MHKSYSAVKHLTRSEIIKNGAIFTPKKITKIVYSWVNKFFNNNTIVGELGAGYGAFVDEFYEKTNYFATESDNTSYNFLKQNFPNVRLYNENSLLNVNRGKYGLSDHDELIIVGNPPYNHFSSLYKKGNKGKLIADKELISRDYGISFLRAYDKLQAEYICVLHPLSYLIKKTNFNQLNSFKDHYKLIKCVIFSSDEFQSIKKSASKFPVVISLYKRDDNGMDFDYIKNFSFNILGKNKRFLLKKFNFIDGYVNKYPSKNSKCPLQFYTIRDINALNRNKSFVKGPIKNGIDINIDNLYQYAWLYYLKQNIKLINNLYIFGNCSPFYPSIMSKKIKNELVWYAWSSEKLVSSFFSNENITKYYGRKPKSYKNVERIISSLNI